MNWLWVQIGLAVVAFLLVGGILLRSGKQGRRLGARNAVGILLVGTGLYFLPLGALEAYDGTRQWLGLTEPQNATLWYAITILLILAGTALASSTRGDA